MRIAIPVWNEKVSPVFDTASRVVILQFEGSRETSRVEAAMSGRDLFSRCHYLKSLGVDVLICGAISRCYRMMLCKSAGITVIPWVSGRCDDVMRAYLSGRLRDSEFLMPGCRWEERDENSRFHCAGKRNRIKGDDGNQIPMEEMDR